MKRSRRVHPESWRCPLDRAGEFDKGGTSLDNETQDETGEIRAPANRKSFRSIYWVPITVIILGMLSIAMLILINYVNERRHRSFALNDAVEHIQFKAAAFHLWLEEAITGDEEVEMEKVWLDIDRAIYLSEALLKGGVIRNDLILTPLEDSNQRIQVENIKSLLTRLKTIGQQRWVHPEIAGIGSALDKDFDAVYREIQSKGEQLEHIFENGEMDNRLRARQIFWGILVLLMFMVSLAARGLWSREVRRKHAEEWLKEAKDELENKVAERTKELRNVNDQLELELRQRRGAEEELRRSEKQLRYLSSQLLAAQENERKRISGELHDEFGQTLASLKHRLYRIQKQSKEDQIELRYECEEGTRYVSQMIENVRRFSRDLSPYTLEYCGLSASLRSLLDDFVKRHHLDITCDIVDLDDLTSKEAHIVIYRIFQEVLNNIGKHAEATRLSVISKTENGHISFFFEDNGKGFDPNGTILGAAAGKGLGLAILNERVRMLGGSLDLRSEENKGTRVSFTIPTK